MRILTPPLRTERDTAEFPRTRSLYPHRRLGPALYDWGGFYAPQPGSDDRPAPPLMVAAVAKWREFALRNPRRALREQAEAERRASVSVADEEAAREEERRRAEEERARMREEMARREGEMLVKGAEAEVEVEQPASVPAPVSATAKEGLGAGSAPLRLSSRREKILERARRNAQLPGPQLLSPEEEAEKRELEEAVRKAEEEAKAAETSTLRERLMRLVSGKWQR